MSKRNDILNYISEMYGTIPEYPFKTDHASCVLRHNHSKKWYGIIMNVQGNKIGLDTNEYIDILNVKCDSDMVSILSIQRGFAPAYHMNKKHWLTILLDGSISDDLIYNLLDNSYELTKKKLER